jgi:thiamine biosynthesis lipoprotein
MTRPTREVTLERTSDHWVGRFQAMASPCEVLMEGASRAQADAVMSSVSACAWRVEDKFSRYRDDNIVHAINTRPEQAVDVDDETAKLLDFAANLYDLSDGGFDITSGVLRRVWTFDGSGNLPTRREVKHVLKHVGWRKVHWRSPKFSMRRGMQLDFGGIGKEYAVDLAAQQARDVFGGSVVVNFGGDLMTTRARRDGQPWRIGIEPVQGADGRVIELHRGGLATSGDARRFLFRDGIRYSHILDPRTGWPVKNAPRSVTIAADTCTQAGMLATLAMLRGNDAGEFLGNQSVRHWIQI